MQARSKARLSPLTSFAACMKGGSLPRRPLTSLRHGGKAGRGDGRGKFAQGLAREDARAWIEEVEGEFRKRLDALLIGLAERQRPRKSPANLTTTGRGRVL